MKPVQPRTITEILDRHVEDMAREPLVLWGDVSHSYEDVANASCRMANALRRLGAAKGEPVSVWSPNCPEYFTAWFGTLRAGAVFNPVNALFRAEEAAYVINHVESRVLFVHPELAPVLKQMRHSLEYVRHVVWLQDAAGEPSAASLMAGESPDPPSVKIEPEDLAHIVYTSGTTGRPKGAMQTHYAWAWEIGASCDATVVWPRDRLGLIMPLFHVNAQATSLAMLAIGGTVAMFPRFSPSDFWYWVEKYQLTTFSAVPTMLAILLGAPDWETHDISSLRYVLCGGAPLSVEVARNFEAAIGATLLEGYGLTEATCGTSVNSVWMPRKIGSIGLPMRGLQMRIVDKNLNELPHGEAGEIAIKGPNVMTGYFKDPETTAETIVDGWLRTGDVGYVDADGYFFVIDRVKDMIIRGGENIYPREIEEVLYANPKVVEAAVVGLPDPVWGEEVRAIVALKPGDAADSEEIRGWCREHLADYKVPKVVEIRMEPLPKNATGKIDRKQLRTGRVAVRQ